MAQSRQPQTQNSGTANGAKSGGNPSKPSGPTTAPGRRTDRNSALTGVGEKPLPK